MRIEDLRYLVQVADGGSINLAVDSCYITQQGLSRIISNPEKELGVQLFFRHNNRIQLTSAGELAVAKHSPPALCNNETMMVRELLGEGLETTVSYGCIYNPSVPRPPFVSDLISIVSQELRQVH